MHIDGYRGEEGQDIVEYALLMPLLLLLTFGIVEFGVLFLAHSTIANAAREGARAGVVPSATLAEVETVTRSRATGVNGDPALLDVVVAMPNDDTVQVRVTYTATLITPVYVFYGGDSTVVLRARATMNRE